MFCTRGKLHPSLDLPSFLPSFRTCAGLFPCNGDDAKHAVAAQPQPLPPSLPPIILPNPIWSLDRNRVLCRRSICFCRARALADLIRLTVTREDRTLLHYSYSPYAAMP